MRPELHLACAAFPALPEEDLAALAADIRERGLLEPITLTPDGLLLDGRCRWDACERVGVEPRTVVYDGDDPVGFVASKNRHRRHLNKGQMAMIVARLSTLRHGSNQYKKMDRFGEAVHQLGGNAPAPTLLELAKQSGLSESYVRFARTILDKGAPNVIAMIDNGEVRPLIAAKAAQLHDRDTQANWTVTDVKNIGGEVVRSFPSYKASLALPKPKPPPKEKPRAMINPPYRNMQWPTKEELDYPKEGSSVEEYDAFFKKYGRTPLHPKAVKEMQDADSLTSGLANAIRTMTHSHHPSPEQFFAYLDHLATHRREPNKTNGAQTDFASRGRTTLAMLEAALPKALSVLHELQEKLAERRSTREREHIEREAGVEDPVLREGLMKIRQIETSTQDKLREVWENGGIGRRV